MENLKIAIGDAFLESFALIPKNKQKKVMEFVAKFRYNPKSSGINYERINDARDPNFRSVRIDQDYRGIVLKPEKGDVYVLLWVARHDEPYDWARRHRCNIHPRTGVLQLLEIQQANDTDLRHSRETPTTQSQPPLFDLSDETFLSLGVPEETLEWVRNLCSVEELEAREKSLPIEAFEALYLLAAGTPLNELLQEYAVPETTAPIDTDDFAGALEHEASRRRFYVVENEMELLEMLEAPLEKWRVFLHRKRSAVPGLVVAVANG